MENEGEPILLFVNSGSGGGVGKAMVELQVTFASLRSIASTSPSRDSSSAFTSTTCEPIGIKASNISSNSRRKMHRLSL